MMAFLEASLIRPLGLVVIAWLVLRIFRVQHPASRHSVWTAVLVGMLVLPIVSVVGPRWTLRVLPARPNVASQPVAPEPPSVPLIAETPASSSVTEPTPLAPAAAAFAWPSTETLIAGAYLVGVSVLTIYRMLGWLLLRRVLARSRSLRPACLRESADVVTPVAVGVLRPSVILPLNWRTWHVRTRRAVLAHEFAHLRRRDTLVAALGRFVTSVLWFHPAAWWVSRQTSDLAELACDAVALQRVGDPGGYSRVLVEFASAVNRSGARISLPGLAIASGSRMNDRVDQVFLMSTGTMRRLARPRVWLAFGMPGICLAATVMLGASDSAPIQNGGASSGQAQSAVSAGPKFDVVSIKPCPGLPPPGLGRGVPPWSAQLSPGYVHWDCVSLAELIDQAYTGADNQLLNSLDRLATGQSDSSKRVRGGPSWVDAEKFTIEIKMSGDATLLAPEGAARRFILVRDAMKPALRTMLEDRFQLKLRKVTEQRSMYALTVAKSGLKITQTAPARCWQRPPGLARGEAATPPPGFEGTPACGFNVQQGRDRGVRQLEIKHGSLKDFAKFLASLMDRYVIDETGVEGRFSFNFEYTPDDNTPGNRAESEDEARFIAAMAAQGLVRTRTEPAEPPRTDGPTIFKAMEVLGLKLEPTKGPAEFLQIASVQRPKPNAPAFAEATAGKPDASETPTSREREMPDAGPSAPVRSASVTTGQAAATPTLKFEAVAIKPCVPPPPTGRSIGGGKTSPGYLFFPCATLEEMIDYAYAGPYNPLLNTRANPRDDEPKRVRGGPGWVYSEKFALEARGGGAEDRATLMGPMLRVVLEDRFQLKARRATDQRAIYALTLAKGGLNTDKVKPTAPDECWVRKPGTPPFAPPGSEALPACGAPRGNGPGKPGNERYEYVGLKLDGFPNVMDRPVMNQTGLDGRYNLTIEFTPDDSTPGTISRNSPYAERERAEQKANPGPGPTIFKALEELGLKLGPTKGPAEYIAIDSVQKPKPDTVGSLARAQGAGLPAEASAKAGGGR